MKRSPISRQSAKGAENADKWQARKRAWLRLHPLCEGAGVLPRQCLGELDVHHLQGRGMGGVAQDTSPLASLCRLHHQWVEEHRVEARELGFLLRSKAYES